MSTDSFASCSDFDLPGSIKFSDIIMIYFNDISFYGYNYILTSSIPSSLIYSRRNNWESGKESIFLYFYTFILGLYFYTAKNQQTMDCNTVLLLRKVLLLLYHSSKMTPFNLCCFPLRLYWHLLDKTEFCPEFLEIILCKYELQTQCYIGPVHLIFYPLLSLTATEFHSRGRSSKVGSTLLTYR